MIAILLQKFQSILLLKIYIQALHSLVLLAPSNSCELHNYYLVLSFFLMYSSSGLSIDVFSNKTNININWFRSCIL